MPKTERPGRSHRPMQRLDFQPKYEPSALKLQAVRRRREDNDRLSRAELLVLVEAGDDDALGELLEWELDRQAETPEWWRELAELTT